MGRTVIILFGDAVVVPQLPAKCCICRCGCRREATLGDDGVFVPCGCGERSDMQQLVYGGLPATYSDMDAEHDGAVDQIRAMPVMRSVSKSVLAKDLTLW